MEATLAQRYCVVNSVVHMANEIAQRYRHAMDITQIRRARLLWLADKFGGYRDGGFAKLGEKVRKDPNVFSQIHTGNRNMGNRMARELEAALGLPRGTMDAPVGLNVRDLILTALGGRAVNPEHEGPIREQPALIRPGSKAAKLSKLKGDTPKEEHQQARGVQKGRKRSAK